MMRILTLSVASIAVVNASGSLCVCDTASGSRRLTEAVPGRVVEFHKADIKGEDFKRTLTASVPRMPIKLASGSCDAEQVHINFGAEVNSMVISYASQSLFTASSVTYSTRKSDITITHNATVVTGVHEAYSELMYMNGILFYPHLGYLPDITQEQYQAMQTTSNYAFDGPKGTFGAYKHWKSYKNMTGAANKPGSKSNPYETLQSYKNPAMYYDSPLLHTVKLLNLTPGKTYYYRVSGSCTIFKFTLPNILNAQGLDTPAAPVYPFNVGLVADIGRTQVSAASLNALSAMNNSLVLLAGDLSYADGYPKIWDAFGQLLQTLGSAVPVMSTGGNHEAASAEAFLSYKVRYPSPNAASGSPHFSYYGYEVGPVHVIALCSYAGFSNTSMQYQWLQNYLATKIDRVRTPWLIALTHVPLYASNSGHYKEGETMRRSMEPLLVAAGVDLVITGHIHAYERISPVINFNLDKCGTNHMVLGDAGNYEASYTPWLMNVTSKAAPTWSAFREASFGVAGLTIHNATHATYAWHRVACDKGFFVQNKNNDGSDVAYYSTNADPDGDQDFSDSCISANDNSIQKMLTVDSYMIVRPTKNQCPNKYAGVFRAAQPVPIQNPTSPPSNIQPYAGASSCFAGSEAIILESGEIKAISDVQIGDRILAADASGKTLYSEVVYIPHGANTEYTQFVHVTTENNALKMTKNHILPSGLCGSSLPLVHASKVSVGDCVQTVSGQEVVTSTEIIKGEGVYTVVTNEEFIVVNGIIASSFGANHMMANLYYNIHRFLYAVSPVVLTSSLLHSVNEKLGMMIPFFESVKI